MVRVCFIFFFIKYICKWLIEIIKKFWEKKLVLLFILISYNKVNLIDLI